MPAPCPVCAVPDQPADEPTNDQATSNTAHECEHLCVQGERRMNLLTPLDKSKLHHADVETGTIVSTYNFQKDTVDIPIKEIAQ